MKRYVGETAGETSLAVAHFLESLGVDLTDAHLMETPDRVARAFREELLAGYQVDVASLFKTFEDSHDQTVIVRSIPFFSLCAHHLLPFYGTADIAYHPSGRLIGLSKLGRVVDCFARRLQLQERLTAQVADAIMEYLEPAGVMVRLRAIHLCMAMRGVQKINAQTLTCVARGTYDDDGHAFSQALDLMDRAGALP